VFPFYDDGDTALDTYTLTPRWTIGSASSNISTVGGVDFDDDTASIGGVSQGDIDKIGGVEA